MAQIATAWILAKPGVTAPIIGTTNLKNLEDILGEWQYPTSRTSSRKNIDCWVFGGRRARRGAHRRGRQVPRGAVCPRCDCRPRLGKGYYLLPPPYTQCVGVCGGWNMYVYEYSTEGGGECK